MIIKMIQLTSLPSCKEVPDECSDVMNLRLGNNAVLFKDTFCLSKKKWTKGQNIHTLVDGLEYPYQN